ncbi:hypothetical protein L9F63_012781, partial [Diploptera punctata]
FSREDSCNGKEGKTTETVCCLCQKWLFQDVPYTSGFLRRYETFREQRIFITK